MKNMRDQRSGKRADVNIDALCTSMCARSIFGLQRKKIDGECITKQEVIGDDKVYLFTHLLFDIKPL